MKMDLSTLPLKVTFSRKTVRAELTDESLRHADESRMQRR